MCAGGQVEVGGRREAIFKVQLKCQEHETVHVYTELSKTENSFQAALKKKEKNSCPIKQLNRNSSSCPL